MAVEQDEMRVDALPSRRVVQHVVDDEERVVEDADFDAASAEARARRNAVGRVSRAEDGLVRRRVDRDGVRKSCARVYVDELVVEERNVWWVGVGGQRGHECGG